MLKALRVFSEVGAWLFMVLLCAAFFCLSVVRADYVTISSGLTLKVPTAGTRNWANEILNNNFQKISEHDHTGSGKGLQIATAAIANGAVTTAKLGSVSIGTSQIANNAVTFAKMAAMSTDRLLGRDTAGTGSVEVIEVTDGIEFNLSGGIRIANDGVTRGKILDGEVTEPKLSDDAATRSTMLIESGVVSNDGSIAITPLYRGPAGQGITDVTLPKTTKVTHLSVNLKSAITSGTLTITLYKNGVTTGKTLVITSGTSNSGSITSEAFSAGDELSLAYTQSSAIGISEIVATAWGHFTE